MSKVIKGMLIQKKMNSGMYFMNLTRAIVTVDNVTFSCFFSAELFTLRVVLVILGKHL